MNEPQKIALAIIVLKNKTCQQSIPSAIENLKRAISHYEKVLIHNFHNNFSPTYNNPIIPLPQNLIEISIVTKITDQQFMKFAKIQLQNPTPQNALFLIKQPQFRCQLLAIQMMKIGNFSFEFEVSGAILKTKKFNVI